MEANNEEINKPENKTISNFINDVFSAALKDVNHIKENLNINNEKKEQKINPENNLNETNNENISNLNKKIENQTNSNVINEKKDLNKDLKIQNEVNLTIKENYLNCEEKEYLKNLNLGKIIKLIKYKNKFLLFRKIEREITKNDEEFNKEIQPTFKSTMKLFKEKEEEEEKKLLEKEQMNPIINPVEIIKTQNSNNEEEEEEKISLKTKPKNKFTEEESNSNLINNSDNNNNNNFSQNSQLLNENQNEENKTIKRIVTDDEVYNKELIPLIKNCYKQYKKEEEDIYESNNNIEVNPIINPVNILNTKNSFGENDSKKSLNNEESKEEYIKNLNENNFNSTASFNKSTLYTTKNLNQQNSNKIPNNNNIKKNNKKENVFNKTSIENKNFKRIKLNYNFPYNKIYNMFKDHSYKLPVKKEEKKQKINEDNNNVENLSFKNSVNSIHNDYNNNSFYNSMKESNLNKSKIRNKSVQIIKTFPYNEEIENKKLLLNQHKIQKNYSSHNIFKNKKESFCKNDCCQFLRKYPWICPKCNKEHKCSHYKCQNCRRSFCFCKK